jgi:hypothetical protein
MEKPEHFGTSPEGFHVNDWCCYCYQDGEFTEPEITMDAMIEKCVSIMASKGIMPEPQARQLMSEMLPRLKRWRR